MRLFILSLLAGTLIGCAASPAYNFRDSDRPVFERTVAPQDVASLIEQGARLIDVRLTEDFAASSDKIPGALYRNPEAIMTWAGDLSGDAPVIVYCVKGKWVSQKAATYLASHNINVYSLEGGIDGWTAQANQLVAEN